MEVWEKLKETQKEKLKGKLHQEQTLDRPITKD